MKSNLCHERTKKYYDEKDSDSILYIDGFSIRTINALSRASITTVSALREMTDVELFRVRNIGAKCLEEIATAVPDRIRTYEGEAEQIEAARTKNKLDSDARRLMRFMESGNMKLSELMKSSYRLSGKRRARQLLAEYCAAFPERINDVMNHFEALNDTSDKFYKELTKNYNAHS